MRGFNRGSGPRSNMYSRSKSSNWGRYDPFREEVSLVYESPSNPLEIELIGGSKVTLYEREVQPDFIRPVSKEDVQQILARIPFRFLDGLKGIHLLGGTRKQLNCFKGNLFRFGAYSPSFIFLFAFPKDLPSWSWRQLPKPTIQREYERMGGAFAFDGKKWRLRFDEESLRKFYLYNVLPHEIGHHVDRENFYRDHRRAERFANWFAETFNCKRGLDDQLPELHPPSGSLSPNWFKIEV